MPLLRTGTAGQLVHPPDVPGAPGSPTPATTQAAAETLNPPVVIAAWEEVSSDLTRPR
jgi:hypothetical protein